MDVELKVPQVGESITEVQIGEWLYRAGDAVPEGEPVVVIETDKVTVELPAPVAGRVTEVLKPKGSQAKVGEVIGYMEAAGAGGNAKPSAPTSKGSQEKAPAAKGAGAAPAKAPAAEAKPDTVDLICLSGRGDKDLAEALDKLGIT